MSARYLLDTDTCIYIRRNRPPHIVARFDKIDPGDVAISVVTYGELIYGAAKSVDPQRAMTELQRVIGLVSILPLPEGAARLYGEIRATLEARGTIIGSNDLWIAAHALSADLTLVTNNEREFKRVKDLRLENWVK
jgi:tRNA(fMet)-specific endonuclease VapC